MKNFENTNVDTGTLKPATVTSVDTLGYVELDTTPIFNKARRDTFPIVKGIKVKDTASDVMLIVVGHATWLLSKHILEKGIQVFDPKTSDQCYQTNLKLILKNPRIYVSAQFRDLRNNQLLGEMDYNHWTVYLKNLLDYNYMDDRLEVKDKQGYVVFSILFSDKGQSSNGAIAFSGYFINPSSILIVNTDPVPTFYTDKTLNEAFEKMKCIAKEPGSQWQIEAEKSIAKIKSVFDQ